MTTGFITLDQEPALRLDIVGPEGARSFEAIIDTGFNGGLAIPPDWIEALGLPRTRHERMVLTDGSVTGTYLYDGYVVLDETAYEVVVTEAPGTPLAGTDLLWGFSLFIEFRADGAVEVNPFLLPLDRVARKKMGTRPLRDSPDCPHNLQRTNVQPSNASGVRNWYDARSR